MDTQKYKNVFYHETDSVFCAHKKFGITNSHKTFAFKNLDYCDNVLECVKECFIDSFSESIGKAKEIKLDPDRIAISIESHAINETINIEITDVSSRVIDNVMYAFINAVISGYDAEDNEKCKCSVLNKIIETVLWEPLTINLMTVKNSVDSEDLKPI